MKIIHLPIVFAIVTLAICSCSRSSSPDLKSSINAAHQYVNSFKGQTSDIVKRRFTGVKIVETAWKEQNLGGKQLVATYPDYEVRVLFLGDKAVTASLQVLSD